MPVRPFGRLAASVAVAGLIAAACGGDDDDSPETTETAETTTTTTTTSTPPEDGLGIGDQETAPLTGESVDEDQPPASRALMVKIGNNDDRARPQAGLVEADIVFEELIEDRKTRFAAVFHTEIPHRIGPVRSGRSSDLDLMADLGQPYLAYSGGNPTVLAQFRAGVSDGLFIDIGILDFEIPYTRDETRDAPDNLYFDFTEITPVSAAAPPPGLFDYSSDVWPDSDDLGDGIVVRYPTSFGRESVHIWDPDLEGWVRIQDGTVHTAEVDGVLVELAPTNVVVLETGYIDSPADAESPQAVTFGSGRAWVLVDGQIFMGFWERAPGQPGFRLLDGLANSIGLRPGPTWVLLANDDSGSARFSPAEVEVLDAETAAAMLADARELASGNGESSS
jgi:hypothetical protein